MAQGQKKAQLGSKPQRQALESISETQMNTQVLINSPKQRPNNAFGWSSNPVGHIVSSPKSSKRGIPKASTEAHLIPYTFSPKSNTLSTKGLNDTSKSQDITAYVTSVKSQKTSKKSENFYKEHLFNTFQALKFVRKLPPVDLVQLQQKKVKIPKKPGFERGKTIVFDLDETLVHCVDEDCENPDVTLSINLPNGENIQAGVKIRPFAKECLIEAAKAFEVIVFTASHKSYADAVLDYLDPDKTLVHSRLYRENCLMIRNIHIKDLRVLRGRKLKNIVIVDNAAYSFAYQLENGIPIISWHDDPNDRELYNLIDYLKVLGKAKDVRDVNREVFRMNSFYEDYIEQYVKAKNV